MSKPRDLKLEPFSLALARRILETFPAWEPHLGRAQEEEDGLMAYVLRVEVPSANPRVSQPLTIAAELNRIVTVSWFPMSERIVWNIDWVGYAFGKPPPSWRDDPSGFDRFVTWLCRFVSEELVAAVWKDEGGGGSFGAFTPDVLAAEENRKGRASLVRSWHGTCDRP